MNQELINEVRTLLKNNSNGVLSTHSLSVKGFPFGSLTPFAIDESGCPIILISALAEHTKNINADSNVCLTIIENNSGGNLQAQARLSVLAHAKKIESPGSDVREAYFARFPESKNYFGTHDFAFYRLEPVRLRYIAGFGKIHWIEKEAYLAQ